jgi:nucleoside-diphosphate-sugar epimerase
MIQDFFLKNVPPVNSKFSWVCVTDVARAHLLALKVPEAGNQRFILNGWTTWVPKMIDMFNEEFGP